MTHIVLLHGALGNANDCKLLAAHLAKAGLIPHLFEFNGHGQQELGPNFSMAGFVQDLGQYLHQHHLQSAALFGYSMGGYVTLRLAQSDKSYTGAIITLATKLKWTKDTAEKEARNCAVEFLKERAPAFYEGLQKKHLHADVLLSSTAQLLLDMPNLEPLRPSDIENKTLHLVGELDKLVSQDETMDVASQLRNGHAQVLAGIKHPLESLDVADLSKLIVDFVSA